MILQKSLIFSVYVLLVLLLNPWIKRDRTAMKKVVWLFPFVLLCLPVIQHTAVVVELPSKFLSNTELIFSPSISLLGLLVPLVSMALFIRHLIQYILSVRKAMKNSILLKSIPGWGFLDIEVRISQAVSSPCCCGLFHPVILIPDHCQLEDHIWDKILDHERYHIHHFDLWIQILCYCLCCVYWFCPFTWIAYRKLRQSMELCCDEAILQESSLALRKQYALALLSFATMKQETLVSFQSNNIEERIISIMKKKQKKTIVWILCATLFTIFLGATMYQVQVHAENLDTQQSNAQKPAAQTSEKQSYEEYDSPFRIVAVYMESFDCNSPIKNVKYTVEKDGVCYFYYE